MDSLIKRDQDLSPIKKNGKKGKVDNKERTDNQRIELFHKCKDSIHKTVSNLTDNIIKKQR